MEEEKMMQDADKQVDVVPLEEKEPVNDDAFVQENEAEAEIPVQDIVAIKEELASQGKNIAKISAEIWEMHKLYHNEFAGRLKNMQQELEQYHEIDRGRAFDDILREVARIYCNNEILLNVEANESVKKQIRYLFMDLEQLLELNGVMMQKSKPGDKRNNKFCQIVNRIETDDTDKHDTVVISKGTGFATEKRPLIKELIDVYIYQDSNEIMQNVDEERS